MKESENDYWFDFFFILVKKERSIKLQESPSNFPAGPEDMVPGFSMDTTEPSFMKMGSHSE